MAFIVVDLGFGDAGKGLLTDYLVRESGATVVVRYNGGAQAGHNVVAPDGRHHTFAQFGSGSFVPGVRTFLSRHVVVHPTALLLEGEALAGKGVSDAFSRLLVSEEARLVTPFHQAAGRLRELARGAARHGSCGVGVGETVRDALAAPAEAVTAGDLHRQALLRRKLLRARERLRAEVEGLAEKAAGPVAAGESEIFERDEVLAGWLAAVRRVATLGLVAPDGILAEWLAQARSVVFEGAHGVLLDEWAGFHPYTTWASCTPRNAVALLSEAAPQCVARRVGVLRSHAVRHGPGPLPTETEAIRRAVAEHNGFGPWQGAVRYGWFDAVLARYALELAGPLDGLALTHLDAPPRLGWWRLASGYELPAGRAGADLVAERPGNSEVTLLAPPPTPDLERQERLTDLLQRVTPKLEACAPAAASLLASTERLLGRRIDLVACGPRAADVAACFARCAPLLTAAP